jgi:hypothetical protein
MSQTANDPNLDPNRAELLLPKKIVIILTILMLLILGFATHSARQVPGAISFVSFLVFFVGIIGGFVGLQRTLRKLTKAELKSLNSSVFNFLLSPLVGGVLALVLYVLFISGLLAGDLFPKFVHGTPVNDMTAIFSVHGEGPKDYAKLFFWSFVAGYSERFVTNIIGRFEQRASEEES